MVTLAHKYSSIDFRIQYFNELNWNWNFIGSESETHSIGIAVVEGSRYSTLTNIMLRLKNEVCESWIPTSLDNGYTDTMCFRFASDEVSVSI